MITKECCGVNPKMEYPLIDGTIVPVLPLNGSGSLLDENFSDVIYNMWRAVMDGSGQKTKIPLDALHQAMSGDLSEDNLANAIIKPAAPDANGVAARKIDLLFGKRHYTAAFVYEGNLCIIYDHPKTP